MDASSPEVPPEVWLVGFRLDAASEGEADLYTLYVDTDRPIVSDQSIVFFADPGLAAVAMERDDDPRLGQLAAPQQVSAVYDVSTALHLLASENYDDQMEILDFLNVLFDLVKATGLPRVPQVKDTLYPLADHLTFSKEYGAYLDGVPGRRGEAIDAVLWCLGAVLSNATLLRATPGPQST